MKFYKYGILVLAFCCMSFSCDEDATDDMDEPDRTNALVTFNNNRGVSGCFPPYSIVFIVSYRDVQASVELSAPNTGFLNVLVEDGESINVKVQRLDNDELVADANIAVRTDSRPASLEGSARTVSFCRAFDLSFQNF